VNTVLFVSPLPGAGKTTVIINLGTALQQTGAKILWVNWKKDIIFNNWLMLPAPTPGTSIIYTTHLGPDALVGPVLPPHDFLADYHYILIEANYIDLAQLSTLLKIDMVCCCFQTIQNSPNELTTLQKNLTADYKNVDLFIPCQTPPGEWELTSSVLMNLSEHLGWEKIADPLPYCEAIHDLPSLHASLWDLPSQYRNRQEAFRSLLQHI
jgi:hypothetical protein